VQLPAKLYKSIRILEYVSTSEMIANSNVTKTNSLTLTNIEHSKIFRIYNNRLIDIVVCMLQKIGNKKSNSLNKYT